jgi:dinuclear metal center YbgI/SA1388 family protein
MANRDKIVDFCKEYLMVDQFQDKCVNGLQIEGKPEVKTIITGVSLSQKFIERAIEQNADMILVHHGLFTNIIGSPPQIRMATKTRIKLLLDHDINLCGFHLPLDAHPVIGNNISLLNILGLNLLRRISLQGYGEIGFMGKVTNAISFDEFVATVNQKLETHSYTIAGGPDKVKKVGIISGGASSGFALAAELGVDTYLCGEVKESIVREVEEVGINFINAGHYNTEKFGIQNLGNLVADKFNLTVKFIDIPCDV